MDIVSEQDDRQQQAQEHDEGSSSLSSTPQRQKVVGNSGFSPEDDSVIAAPAATRSVTMGSSQEPNEIPLVGNDDDDDTLKQDGSVAVTRGGSSDSTQDENDNENENDNINNNSSNRNNDDGHDIDHDNDDDDGDGEDDESEYEYEDDDDAAFSGFLAPTVATVPCSLTTSSTNNNSSNSNSDNGMQGRNNSSNAGASANAPARIEEEVSNSSSFDRATGASKKWREPSRAAVNMSLRAEQETTGSKRRLAQDLYRIMNQDTEEAGFSLAPKSDDCMDKWTIKLFQFDEDSNLAKDMLVLGLDHIQLEMTFPDQYPFEPPFVRVVRPRFKRQTGFVMNGALCMELLTKDGWNPINDIESVIVSIRSLLVVGDGRLQAASDLTDTKYEALLRAATSRGDSAADTEEESDRKRQKLDETDQKQPAANPKPVSKEEAGTYSAAEAQAAYSHLSDYHKKKGWDSSGWWSRKG